jgi:hypothetical protein
MGVLARYTGELTRVRASGEASDELSYYPALLELLNSVGDALSPAVHCVLTPKNRGAGVPDGGLFLKRSLALGSGSDAIETRAPERGVVEVKGPSQTLKRVAASRQVRKYLDRYGQVLLTNYREFLLLRLAPDGEVSRGEGFSLADTEAALWALDAEAKTVDALEDPFEQFLRRVLLADAPLSSPQDLIGGEGGLEPAAVDFLN